MTSDELRVTSDELTPALRRWVEKLEAGYTIRRGTIVHARSFPRWSWQLFNPEGVYVQTVRADTVRRLRDLGFLQGVTMEGINVTKEKDDGVLR